MTANLQNPIFTDEIKAREWLEARVWPTGPGCPHCGATGDDVTKLEGKAHRPGLYQCSQCREQFTVTVKTVFERSKIPLTKWLAALFLLTASKCSHPALIAETLPATLWQAEGAATWLHRLTPGREAPCRT
jgi:transposase-like protein